MLATIAAISCILFDERFSVNAAPGDQAIFYSPFFRVPTVPTLGYLIPPSDSELLVPGPVSFK